MLTKIDSTQIEWIFNKEYSLLPKLNHFVLTHIDNAHDFITKSNHYNVTGLYSFDKLSMKLGISSLFIKNEGERFYSQKLKCFKSLGTTYAVLSYLKNRFFKENIFRVEDAMSKKYQSYTSNITFCAATDGNHGRGLAWVAKQVGAKCVILAPKTLSKFRCEFIKGLGAELILISGTYEDAIIEMLNLAKEKKWIEISDTARLDYTEIPLKIMQGYGILTKELIEQLPKNISPTHVFVPCGVGGLAATVATHLYQYYQEKFPKIISIEPYNAACLFNSIKDKKNSKVMGELSTIMSGLACGELSTIAWEILQDKVYCALKIQDSIVYNLLKSNFHNNIKKTICLGETGISSLAGFLSAIENKQLKEELELNKHSNVIIIGTEGITDPNLYKEIVSL